MSGTKELIDENAPICLVLRQSRPAQADPGSGPGWRAVLDPGHGPGAW